MADTTRSLLAAAFLALAVPAVLCQAPGPAKVPAGPPNVTAILEKGGQYTTLIRLMKATQQDTQLNSQLNGSSTGFTVFAPTDNAFNNLKPGMLNGLSQQEQVSLVQAHIVPQFFSMESFETASNPVRTQASGADGPYTVNITATGTNQVNVSTGIVSTSVGKICVEEQKFEILFATLCSTNDAERSDGGESGTEFNAKHAFLLGALSKCLTSRPKEVNVSDSFAIHVFNVQKHAAETVDFTRRGSSPLPTDCPAIDVLGYSLVLLKDICAWESPSSESEIQVPVDSLLQTGLVKRLLKYLAELEPPSTIRKSMVRGHGDHPPALATAKVCPYIGYRRDLVAVIANCLHGRKQVQDEVRQLNGIMLLLQQCVIDEENPYLREWGLLAVKNLLEGNVENQEEVSELQMQEPVITPEIADIGLRVEINKETGHPKLVNTS